MFSHLPVSLLPLFATLLTASPILRRQDMFDSCLSAAPLAPITVTSDSYGQDIAAYNQRLQPSPAAVVYPSSPELVAAAIACARAANVSVSARSGGHSYASYGLGGDDGALVIDLNGFKDIVVNSDGTAKIGAGSKLGDIALALNNQSRALPHGTCPWVGIGGHASYGGFGYAGRQWGLTVDQIIGFDVVLANSTILTDLSPSQDADLFWALSGAAPSYGLITSFYFKTYPTPPEVINFKYSFPSGTLSSTQTASLFSAYQSFGASSAPANLGLGFTIGYGLSIDINGVYYGNMDGYHATMDGFVGGLPGGYQTTLNDFSWIESLNDMAGGQSLDTTSGSDSRDDFSAKSLMTPSDVLISDAALNSFFDYLLNTQTSTNWFVEVNLYGGNNSVINSLSMDDNSFGHRDKLLTFQMYASSPSYGPPYPDEGFSFVDGMFNAIVSPMGDGWNYAAYVNYVDDTLSADEVKNLYWGTQYPRLATLRTRYDPTTVFKNPQSIVGA